MANMRLVLDGAALVANWCALDGLSGAAATGAAVKADGYGLGARDVVARLSAAGCRSFFVAHWQEAQALAGLVDPASIAVLHGIAPGEEALALATGAVPVLNSAEQIARWHNAVAGTGSGTGSGSGAGSGVGRCHVMVDTGMGRLGLDWRDDLAGRCAGLDIDLCMSHLASADENSRQNALQLERFGQVRAAVAARRYSLANSAGISLGSAYHFDCTRPGLALYGGIACAALGDIIRPVVAIQARILQVRALRAGDTIGYGASFSAPAMMRTATLSLGYADGFKRGLSGRGGFLHDGRVLPVLGRVSMDLTCIDISQAPELREGDWVTADFQLAQAEAATGISQYEWLTQLGDRFDRVWLS